MIDDPRFCLERSETPYSGLFRIEVLNKLA